MVKATPQNFEFSIKVPERITHKKKLDINKDVMSDFKEFLDKISPLYSSGKLGAILIQLPPTFSIEYFNTLEKFLETYLGNQKKIMKVMILLIIN